MKFKSLLFLIPSLLIMSCSNTIQSDGRTYKEVKVNLKLNETSTSSINPFIY